MHSLECYHSAWKNDFQVLHLKYNYVSRILNVPKCTYTMVNLTCLTRNFALPISHSSLFSGKGPSATGILLISRYMEDFSRGGNVRDHQKFFCR